MWYKYVAEKGDIAKSKYKFGVDSFVVVPYSLQPAYREDAKPTGEITRGSAKERGTRRGVGGEERKDMQRD